MNKLFTFFRESQTARMLIPIGLSLIIFGSIMFYINTKNQNYVKTEATVSRIELAQEGYTDTDGNYVETTYKVFVKYVFNDVVYEAELGELSGYKENDKVTIYYNPNSPNEITQTKSLVTPIILVVGGIAALTGGIISGANAIKKQKKLKEQEKGWKNE